MSDEGETWMTRREAATHLRVSTRQLDRLRLPCSLVGTRSPRYARSTLDNYVRQLLQRPTDSKRGGRFRPPPFVSRSAGNDYWLEKIDARRRRR